MPLAICPWLLGVVPSACSPRLHDRGLGVVAPGIAFIAFIIWSQKMSCIR